MDKIANWARWSIVLFITLVVKNAQVLSEEGNFNLTLLESAVSKGAVCLDGSPPSYSYIEGTGNGTRSWIVFLEGGGWCLSKADCLVQARKYTGSSSYHSFKQGISSAGIFDPDTVFNPYFYNWNKFYVHYCDQSLFMSDIERVDPATNLTFRGARIYDVMIDEMLNRGMRNAENAFLTGASAGGLATVLHCDKFHALFSNTTRVKCLSDSGFFIRGKGKLANITTQHFSQVIQTHELAELLPKSCTSKRDPNLCVFPEYLVGDVSTPLFIIESAFDTFQIEYNFIFTVKGLGPIQWGNCYRNLKLCNSTKIGIIKGYRPALIETLMKLDNSSSRGIFVDSCYRHGHIAVTDGWLCSTSLANKTIAIAVGDWFFDRSSFREIDIDDTPRNCSNSDNGGVCSVTLSRNGSEKIINSYALQLIIFCVCLYMYLKEQDV